MSKADDFVRELRRAQSVKVKAKPVKAAPRVRVVPGQRFIDDFGGEGQRSWLAGLRDEWLATDPNYGVRRRDPAQESESVKRRM